MSNYGRNNILSRRPESGPVRMRGTKAIFRFARDESGAMLIFGLFMFVIMLMVGGVAVDLMRYEAERTKIQNTADTAALAAASMRQELDPYDVVADYFDKAGIGANLVDTVVDDGLNFRNVRAVTELSVRNYFMHMVGIDKLESAGAGAAEERKTNVEIALVLDISGSMDGTRIRNLRSAANEFIDEILKDDVENRVSISIVPYNGQVNIGPHLISKFPNITDRHNNAYCVDLPPSVYNSAALPRNTVMPQHAAADTYNNQSTRAPSASNRWCEPASANHVRVHSNNSVQLRNQISSLHAIGATSIDAGLRWGSALLDPSMRSVVSDLADDGQVPGYFRGRPFDYDDPEVLKVIVLMTDGEHWPNEYVRDGFRSGPSPIYKSSNGRYSIYHADRSGSNKYFWQHDGKWYNRPDGATSATNLGRTQQLDWQQVWGEMRLQWAADQLYRRPLGGTLANWTDHLRGRDGRVIGAGPHEVSAMNNRLDNLCSRVKEQNVVIFGIAFEAPRAGAEVIRDCATNNRFYDVDGLEITTAFRQIRSQISSLRLTQ